MNDHDAYPPADPAISYNFPLDVFQQKAVMAIHRGDNVLVTAKTGSGKTLVGEYQIAYSLREGKRIFYTTPIKSLSNQKYHDLKKLFPSATVGIMTGDIKSAPESDIVVMTTEILRNLLFKQSTATASLGTAGQISLAGLGAVVFDEVHYINDPDRGHVWEETLILLDPAVRLILLSATIDAPEAFASWLERAKGRPMVLLQTKHRVVPLIHGIFDPSARFGGGVGLPLMVLKDGDEGSFVSRNYVDWLKGKDQRAKAADEWARKVRAAGAAGESVAGSADKVKLHSFTHSMNECVSVLKERDLLPALFFTFSRKECERYAEQIQGSLIDSSDTASVKHMIGFHLHRHKEVLESLSQYHQIVRLLERGIAFHHSGLLPLLKEIVELLFSRGFVKILFCTETFAVGLNMPARTVVFLDLKKPSEEGIRLVRPDEYIQMAGRAGRRGKDTRGVVLYLPARNPLSPEELRTVLTGPLVPLTSRLSFHYDFLLKALHAGERLWSTVIDASYWTCQRRVAVESVRAEMSVLAERRATMGLAADTLGAFEEMRGLEAQVKTLTNAPRRKAQVLLDQWKDRHRGPTWDKARAVWVEWERMGHQIAGLERDIVGLTSDVEVCRVAPIVRGLEELGCVGVDRVLTAFGTCCTEFNEGNPLLLGRLYTSGLLASASAAEIVGVLGSFIVDREAEEKTVHPRSLGPIVSDKVKEVLMTIDEWGQEGVRIDRKCGIVSPDAYWSLTTLWVEIGTQWYLGESAAALRLKYDIYEGNLMRGILKLVALVNEWMSVATFCADVHMLDTCRDISGTLMRDLAQPESLYLTM